jgi:hypothetical protein
VESHPGPEDIRAARERSDLGCCAGKQSSIAVLGVARYDWSDAETVRWTVLDSSYAGGGEGLVQIARGVDGGSQVHAEWTYTGARLMQRPRVFLINHGMGRFILRMWASALDRYAESSSR